MAMIVCPECKESISTKAEHCVHCGCKITFCPECETVCTGSDGACPECGYFFEKEVMAKEGTATEDKEKKETLDQLLEEYRTKEERSSGLEIAGSVFFFIHIGLIALTVLALVLINFIPIGFSIMYIAAKYMIALAGLCMVIAMLFAGIDEMRKNDSFTGWCITRGIDVKELIKESLDFRETTLAQDAFTMHWEKANVLIQESTELNKNSKKVRTVILWLLAIVGQVISSYCFVRFLQLNLPAYVLAVATDIGFKFSMIGYWRILIPLGIMIVVVMVVGGIIYGVHESLVKKRNLVWLENNIPEAVERYNELKNYCKKFEPGADLEKDEPID